MSTLLFSWGRVCGVVRVRVRVRVCVFGSTWACACACLVLVRVHERVRVAENPKTPLASEGCSQCQKIPFAPPRSAEDPQTPLANDALSCPRGANSCV